MGGVADRDAVWPSRAPGTGPSTQRTDGPLEHGHGKNTAPQNANSSRLEAPDHCGGGEETGGTSASRHPDTRPDGDVVQGSLGTHLITAAVQRGLRSSGSGR